jgi:hypothetical protein
MTRLHPCFPPSINAHPECSERNANYNYHEMFPTTKMIKISAVNGKEKSPWGGSHEFSNHP